VAAATACATTVVVAGTVRWAITASMVAACAVPPGKAATWAPPRSTAATVPPRRTVHMAPPRDLAAQSPIHPQSTQMLVGTLVLRRSLDV
jgi:hypothetical protein